MTDNIVPFDPSIKTTASTSDEDGLAQMCEFTYNLANSQREKLEEVMTQLAHVVLALQHIEDDTLRKGITAAEVDNHLQDLALVEPLISSVEEALVD